MPIPPALLLALQKQVQGQLLPPQVTPPTAPDEAELAMNREGIGLPQSSGNALPVMGGNAFYEGLMRAINNNGKSEIKRPAPPLRFK